MNLLGDLNDTLIQIEAHIIAAVLELPTHPALPHLAGAHDCLQSAYNVVETAALSARKARK